MRVFVSAWLILKNKIKVHVEIIMNVIEFVNYYNLIRPSKDEIKESTSSISNDITLEVLAFFDLQITSMVINDEPILDLIENTNICDTTLSVFQFYNVPPIKSIRKICSIEEMGELYFNEKTKDITFDGMYEANYVVDIGVTQLEFLQFFLKYLEISFNRIFRKKSESKRLISAIELNPVVVNKIEAFKELLLQEGVDID